ncbi:MAG: MBL fold metallo-hydrolase [Candidatus Margulisiibacteriota bacterium]|jgi:ribonuclease BN (tRNA processing enzyme)
MDFIKFLGTAGARVVVSKQLRASGGIWLSLDGTNLYLDPGPGALVKTLGARPKLDPANLDGILLSHKHLDHSGDINAMIEAMTEGTFKKRGAVFAPKEALVGDPVILKYVRQYPERLEILKAKGKYNVGALTFTTPVQHVHHNTEAYGFKIKGEKTTVSYIADTKFFPGLIRAYRASDILVVSVLRQEPSHLEHLCVEDLKKLVQGIKPRVTIMTHFGKLMLAAKPWLVAEQLSRELKSKIIAAGDGMTYKI